MSTRTRILILILASGLAVEAGASTPNTGSKPWDTELVTDSAGAVPYSVTDHMTCVIIRVRENRVLEIWDEKSDTSHYVRVTEEVGIEARRKKDFQGRKKLAFSDLDRGQRVKVTYNLGDGKIVGIRVIDLNTTVPGL